MPVLNVVTKDVNAKPRKCKRTGCTGSLAECRALPPDVEICSSCRKGEHVDHHAGVWRYSDDTHGVVCNCPRCEPDFKLEPTAPENHAHGSQLALGLDLKWSELKPNRAKQKPVDDDLFGRKET